MTQKSTTNAAGEVNWDAGVEVSAPTVKFGSVGDRVAGTLLNVKKNIKTKYGDKGIVYEIKAAGGHYHDIDSKTKKGIGEPIPLTPGASYSFFANGMLHDKLKQFPMGEKVIVMYKEDVTYKSGNEGKGWSVRDLGHDDSWIGQTGIDLDNIQL